MTTINDNNQFNYENICKILKLFNKMAKTFLLLLEKKFKTR